jgi:hypothetical protein
MGLVDDILQGLPVNSILREQVSQLNAQKAAVDEQNAILTDDNRELKAEIAKLKKQIEELTHHDDLEDIDIELLRLIAIADGRPWAEAMAEQLGVHVERAEYHLQKLQAADYIERHFGAGYPDDFGLRQKARDLLIKKNLI